MTVAQPRAAGTSDHWPVRRSPGGWLGLAATSALLLAGAAMLWLSLRELTGLGQLAGFAVGAACVGLATAVGIAAVGFFRLSYQIGPGRLVVRGGGQSDAIPLDKIEGIYAGQRVGQLRNVRGLSWPGYYVGSMRGRGLGLMRVYCTDRRIESLSVIVTADRALVLTPHDPPAFRRELIRRIEASSGTAPAVRSSTMTARYLPHPVVAGCFAAAAALLVAAVVAVQSDFPGLPDLVPLLPEPVGRPPVLSPREQIFNVPLIGAAILACNLLAAAVLRGRAAAASSLLAASSALAEGIVLLAALRILAR